jgi:hypothetical protein
MLFRRYPVLEGLMGSYCLTGGFFKREAIIIIIIALQPFVGPLPLFSVS